MRIVGGRWAGQSLTSPADRRVRPTSEGVRAALLDALAPELKGARVLDLFAGTGALGLEALSRGAACADFVETRPASLHALRANVAALHVRERTRIFKRDAIPFAAALPAAAYDIAFADPPYGSRMADRVIESWLARPYARLLVVEHEAEQPLPGGGRRQMLGETAVTVYRTDTPPGAVEPEPGGLAAEPEPLAAEATAAPAPATGARPVSGRGGRGPGAAPRGRRPAGRRGRGPGRRG